MRNQPAVHHMATIAHPTRAKRILVVDDNLEAGIMLGLLLRQLGCIVITTDSGPKAIGWGEGLWPDVVLLDLEMPGMDGFETCRALRRSEWGAATTVIAVTGLSAQSDKERSKAAGFDLHLVKPVSPTLMRDALNAAPYMNEPNLEQPMP
jgi:CheY-like chemotaxis protein